MSNQTYALEDQSWQLVKSAIMDPETSQLSEVQTAMLGRITSLARIIDRHPQGKSALRIHQAKYPEISRRTAARDLYMAMELNVSQLSFNYDFWHNWLINDIVDAITTAKAKGDLKSWNAAHANLIRAIGERPIDVKDPKLVEKHTFLIQINNPKAPGSVMNIDTRNLGHYTPTELKEFSDGLYHEITEEDAEEIFKT